MIPKRINFKIPIPEGASVYAEKDDKAKDLLLYEVDQLEILEEVDISDSANIHFNLKDGQFVNKGEVIFTEGLLGHKAMVADFSGIIEIKNDKCRILGQKKHIERRVNLNASVIRVVPNKFVQLKCEFLIPDTIFYTNYKAILTPQVYFENKDDISQDKFDLANMNVTYFVNDNLYVEEIAKLVAFGARRLVVNSVFVGDLKKFHDEINKLESFCILSGYGEFVSRFNIDNDEKKDILWGKKRLYLSDEIKKPNVRVFEHPFWGISGKSTQKNELIGELNYNREVIEFYLKNLKNNE